MKEALINMYKLINQQGVLQAQIAADVMALKAVISGLDPALANALKTQIEIERAKVQEHLDGLKMLGDALNASISSLPS